MFSNDKNLYSSQQNIYSKIKQHFILEYKKKNFVERKKNASSRAALIHVSLNPESYDWILFVGNWDSELIRRVKMKCVKVVESYWRDEKKERRASSSRLFFSWVAIFFYLLMKRWAKRCRDLFMDQWLFDYRNKQEAARKSAARAETGFSRSDGNRLP